MSSFRAGQICYYSLHWLSLQHSAAEPIARPHPAMRRWLHRKREKKRSQPCPWSADHRLRRAAEIQTALIRKSTSRALRAEMGNETQVAMRQYQSDHGWQTKLTPDSRALISLGLGPNHTRIQPLVAASSSGGSQSRGTNHPGAVGRAGRIPWLRFIPFRSRLLLQIKQKARAIARAFCHLGALLQND